MSTKSSNSTGINWESNEIAERRNRGRAQRFAMHGPATQMMLDLAGVKTGISSSGRSGRHGRSNSHSRSARWGDWLRFGHGHFRLYAEAHG